MRPPAVTGPGAYISFMHQISVGRRVQLPPGVPHKGFMSSWKSAFYIKDIEDPAMFYWIGGRRRTSQLFTIDGRLVGTYDSERYATKQAKYRYKKMMAKVEKILLS